MINLDGTGLMRITNSEGFDGFLVFSPDGRYLVFGSNRNNGGTAKLTPWFHGSDYVMYDDPARAVTMQQKRNEIITKLRQGMVSTTTNAVSSIPFEVQTSKDKIIHWSDRAQSFIAELYLTHAAIAQVSQRYFDGHPTLFSDRQRDLDRLIEGQENLIDLYNRTLAFHHSQCSLQVGQHSFQQRRLCPDGAGIGGTSRKDRHYLGAIFKGPQFRKCCCLEQQELLNDNPAVGQTTYEEKQEIGHRCGTLCLHSIVAVISLPVYRGSQE
jgi:hypothetical protein